MKSAKVWIIGLVLALLALVTPVRAAHADPLPAQITGSISDARAAVVRAEGLGEALLKERDDLEARYQSHLKRIEALKQARGDINPIGDEALRAALGEARALAEQLNALTARLGAAHQDELKARKQLAAHQDEALSALEGQLVTATTAQQPRVLAELADLQREQARNRSRLSQLQSVRAPAAIPQLADLSSSDPDELLAAAGELQDHEERLREELKAIEQRVALLENRSRVSKMAEDFLDEDSIFTEDQATIRISTTTRLASATPTGAATGSTGSNSAANGTTEKTDSTTTAGDPQGLVAGGGGSSSGGEPTAAPPGMEANSPSDDVSFQGGADSDPNASRTNEDTAIGAPEPLPPVVEPPTSLEPSITTDSVVRSDADPSVIVRSDGGLASTDGKSELKRLREKQKRLRDALKDVSAQERALRERAHQLSAP